MAIHYLGLMDEVPKHRFVYTEVKREPGRATAVVHLQMRSPGVALTEDERVDMAKRLAVEKELEKRIAQYQPAGKRIFSVSDDGEIVLEDGWRIIGSFDAYPPQWMAQQLLNEVQP